MTLSSFDRSSVMNALSNRQFDILVVGGGITGAGIALDAVSRGLSVALVELEDYGSGTSGRSTKLIHGGLRYLKQGEFSLVREVARERQILHRAAPHIVQPGKMLLPIVKGGSLGRWTTRLGLAVYDLLAGVQVGQRARMLSPAAALRREPALKQHELLGAALYTEYTADDARLVIEVIKTAASMGAVCLNHAGLAGFRYDETGKITGGKVTDSISAQQFDISASTVINATGPWVDRIRERDDSTGAGKRLLLTKGVHLVFSRKRLPLSTSVYFDTGLDNRMIFAIPRQHVVYAGTTDTVYEGDVGRPTVNRGDVDYLLHALNHMFPASRLVPDDVVSTWAGLRPLIRQEGRAPSEVSRRDEVFISSTGLISIAGGKLTGYRKMAQRAVNKAMSRLSRLHDIPFRESKTQELVLSGGALDGEIGVPGWIGQLCGQFPHYGKNEIQQLVFRYGTNASRILEQAGQDGDRGTLIYRELDYCMQEEAAATLSDFGIQRSGRLYFEYPSLLEYYRDMHLYIAERMGYGGALADALLEQFETSLKDTAAWREHT